MVTNTHATNQIVQHKSLSADKTKGTVVTQILKQYNAQRGLKNTQHNNKTVRNTSLNALPTIPTESQRKRRSSTDKQTSTTRPTKKAKLEKPNHEIKTTEEHIAAQSVHV